MTKILSLFLGLSLLVAHATSVASAARASINPQPKITVFAAASLKESVDAIATEWKKQSGQEVLVSYAGSSALAKQIEQGAPTDIFISADVQWMDYLQRAKKIDSKTRFNLVGNELVLIAPAASKQIAISLNKPDGLLKALGDGRLAVAETASVPAGRYAKQSLTKMKVWDTVSTRLAQADNVRAAMAFVARGESPLGIVYATDAKAETKVRVIATFADDSHDAIIYPAAKVTTASPILTSGFLKFLKEKKAMTIFKQAGFKSL
ncbi:MAG: molybdate ABC transporter substrate-binding protein [Arenimonas sp.]